MEYAICYNVYKLNNYLPNALQYRKSIYTGILFRFKKYANGDYDLQTSNNSEHIVVHNCDNFDHYFQKIDRETYYLLLSVEENLRLLLMKKLECWWQSVKMLEEDDLIQFSINPWCNDIPMESGVVLTIKYDACKGITFIIRSNKVSN